VQGVRVPLASASPKTPSQPHPTSPFPHYTHVCKGAIGKVSIVWVGRRGQHRHRFAGQLMGVKSEQWVSISIYDCPLDYPGQWGSLPGWMGSWLSLTPPPLRFSQNDITFSAEFRIPLESASASVENSFAFHSLSNLHYGPFTATVLTIRFDGPLIIIIGSRGFMSPFSW